MSKTLPISEAKTRLPELVSAVAEGDDEIVVTKNGRPVAVLVSHDTYRRQQETLDVLSDPEVMRQIRLSRRYFSSGAKGQRFEDVFGEPLVVRRARSRR